MLSKTIFYNGMRNNSVFSRKHSQSPFDKNIDCYGIVLHSVLEEKNIQTKKIDGFV